MIVFINGSFGVGKTTIANLLLEKISDSLLFDPEDVGSMLQRIIQPIAWSGDFQDYPMWRSLVVETAKGLLQNYNRTLVMPMTIWRDDYFNEVMSGLNSLDSDVHHFCLIAPGETIRRRLRERGNQDENDWVFKQIDHCVSAFKAEQFEKKIDSADKTPEEITQIILDSLV